MLTRGCLSGLLLLLVCSGMPGQDALTPASAASSPFSPSLPTPSTSEKWDFFLSETVTPMIFVAVIPDAVVSQMTRSAPLYGKHFWKGDAFGKRAGSTLGDDVSQNFFSDFLLASAFHEDTRYLRKGPSRKVWPRIGYAISRAVIARNDSGEATFNFANVAGCAMSAGLSNAYYTPKSRTASVAAVNWGTNIAGAGLTNLMPEFGSEVGHWMSRHILFRH